MFHSYITVRIKDSLHVDLFATSMGQRSIKYKGSKAYPYGLTAMSFLLNIVCTPFDPLQFLRIQQTSTDEQ